MPLWDWDRRRQSYTHNEKPSNHKHSQHRYADATTELGEGSDVAAVSHTPGQLGKVLGNFRFFPIDSTTP